MCGEKLGNMPLLKDAVEKDAAKRSKSVSPNRNMLLKNIVRIPFETMSTTPSVARTKSTSDSNILRIVWQILAFISSNAMLQAEGQSSDVRHAP